MTTAIVLSATVVLALLSLAFLVELSIRARNTDPAIEWLDQRQIVLRPYGLWTHPFFHAGTNGEGFRFHRDFSRKKKPGTFRTAVLGGSAVWGTGVAVNQTLAAHMETSLAERRVADPEVLNFGIGGFESTAELIQLTLNALSFKPDYVVIFDGWNDMAAREFIPHMNEISARYKTVIDQANLGVSGLRMSIENALLNTYTGRPFAFLFRYAAEQENRDNLVRKTAKIEMERPVRRPNGEWNSDVYYTNLKSIAGVLREHDIEMVFVFQPYNATLFEEEEWNLRVPYVDFEETFFRVCRETRSRCYSMDGTFVGPEVDSLAFLDIVHFSNFGNRVVGNVLADLVLSGLDPAGESVPLPPAGRIRLDTPPAVGDSSFPIRVDPIATPGRAAP